MHVFVATQLFERNAVMDEEEQFEVCWLSPEKVNRMIRSNDICIYSALATWASYMVSDFRPTKY